MWLEYIIKLGYSNMYMCNMMCLQAYAHNAIAECCGMLVSCIQNSNLETLSAVTQGC